MKIFKKIITLALVVSMLLSAMAPSAFAGFERTDNSNVSINSSIKDLKACFKIKKASTANMKYAYYSPVKDDGDTTEYPVVIYIHGLFHGWTDSTFVESGLTYWAAPEIQAMFSEGGAHLIMPKIPELTISAAQVNNVYKVITEYIKENEENVDAGQVLIMGGSAGGGLAWNLLINHPDLFSAGVVLCATKIPTAKELEKCNNLPIWTISARTDPLINFTFNQKPTWNRICQYSKVSEKCRWTVFDSRVTLPDGSNPFVSHFLAKTIGYNLALISDNRILPGCTTVDGAGRALNLSLNNSIIQWFQENSRSAATPAE